jgi:hypothetical protein
MTKFFYHRLSPGNEVLVCRTCHENGTGSPAHLLSLIKLAGKDVVFCPNCEAREDFNFEKEGREAWS